MRFLTLFLLTILLGACQPPEVEMGNEDGKVNAFGDANSGINETDYSVCNRGLPVGIASSNWALKTRTSEGVEETTELYVSMQGEAAFHKRCVYNGRSTVLNGRVPAVFTNSMDGTKGVLDFNGGLNEKSEIGDSAQKLTCRLRVDSGRLNYQFNGRCLELSRTLGGNSPRMVMVPF